MLKPQRLVSFDTVRGEWTWKAEKGNKCAAQDGKCVPAQRVAGIWVLVSTVCAGGKISRVCGGGGGGVRAPEGGWGAGGLEKGPGVRKWSPFDGGILRTWLNPTAGEHHVYETRSGYLSLCSQAPLLPLGVPPTPAPAMLHTKSFPRPQSLEGAHHHRCEKCHTGPEGSGSLSGGGVDSGFRDWSCALRPGAVQVVAQPKGTPSPGVPCRWTRPCSTKLLRGSGRGWPRRPLF